MNTLQGKVVLVTGGGRGLGEAICHKMGEAGAITVVADIRGDLAEKVSRSLMESGAQSTAMAIDITDDRHAELAIQNTLSKYGRIDAMINNAAIDRTVSIEELSIGEWDRIMATNLRAPFVFCKMVLPIMRKQGHGHIVNVASTAAKRAWPNAAAYHASKWGLLGFTHALHTEARKDNIKVTALVTGGMRTPFLLDRFPDIDVSTLQDPKGVAETIRFVLTSPEETVIPEVMTLPMRETSWP